MKKLIMFVGTLALTGSIVAQKPASDASHYSLEGLANINTTNGISWNAPSIRLRYFVTDNIAARVQFGFGGDGSSIAGIPSKETNYYANSSFDKNGSEEIKRSSMDVKLGAEYHLKGTDKMSPYFAANIGIGRGSMDRTGTDVLFIDPTDPTSALTYTQDVDISVTGGFKSFGWGLGAGFDYYVADNLYLGLELNLSNTKVTNENSVVEVITPASTTTITSTGSTKSYTNIGAAHGSVRIGWRF